MQDLLHSARETPLANGLPLLLADMLYVRAHMIATRTEDGRRLLAELATRNSRIGIELASAQGDGEHVLDLMQMQTTLVGEAVGTYLAHRLEADASEQMVSACVRICALHDIIWKFEHVMRWGESSRISTDMPDWASAASADGDVTQLQSVLKRLQERVVSESVEVPRTLSDLVKEVETESEEAVAAASH